MYKQTLAYVIENGNTGYFSRLRLDKIHWLLCRGWKKQMTLQNRQSQTQKTTTKNNKGKTTPYNLLYQNTGRISHRSFVPSHMDTTHHSAYPGDHMVHSWTRPSRYCPSSSVHAWNAAPILYFCKI